MAMEKITARTNEKIKHAVRLGESASLRKQAGEFFLEGARLCFDAVQTGIEIKQAFFTAKALWKYSEYTESIIAKSEVCYEISAEVSQKLSDTENPQGVFCICAIPDANKKGIEAKGRYLALENLQDPSNLGAICRSAEAIGLDGLIVSGGCDIYNPKALRAAMGSSLRMNVVSCENLGEVLDLAHGIGMLTLASVPRDTAEDIRTVSKDGGVICCVGNEGNGLTEQTIAQCKKQVVIPMVQHIGAPCTPLVQVGDRVLRGTKVGDGEGLCVPVHASVSGTVKAVEMRPHTSGTLMMSVVIENDHQGEQSHHPRSGAHSGRLHRKLQPPRRCREKASDREQSLSYPPSPPGSP